VQFGDAIGIELGVAELKSPGDRIFSCRQILHQRALRRLDDPGSRQEVANPQPVAIEKREQGEQQRPYQPKNCRQRIGDAHPTASGDNRQRQKDLDLAHQIAGDDLIDRQAGSVA
jgi:hypothetical protein